MQSIMGPMNLTDNGLVKKYIMGSRDRVWGESLDGCVFWGVCVWIHTCWRLTSLGLDLN